MHTCPPAHLKNKSGFFLKKLGKATAQKKEGQLRAACAIVQAACEQKKRALNAVKKHQNKKSGPKPTIQIKKGTVNTGAWLRASPGAALGRGF